MWNRAKEKGKEAQIARIHNKGSKAKQKSGLSSRIALSPKGEGQGPKNKNGN